MNELLIRVSSALHNFSDVTVNGEKKKFVNNGRGSYELKLSTDENVEIQLERKHELLSPLWLLWGLLFFVISCFGIFDIPYAKRGALCCRVNVIPNGNGAVQFNPSVKKDGSAVVITNSDCNVEELENSLNYALIKKRLRTLRIIKLLLWLALIATIILIVVL